MKFYDNIYLRADKKDTSKKPIYLKLDLLYADTVYDFALLEIKDNLMDSEYVAGLQLRSIPQSMWKDIKDITEGENVMYLGYPMSKGIEKRNYPLVRIGTISQVIPGNKTFLIDGFVQHGHSGSPVFLLREISNRIDFYLIGIATSFPAEYTDIYKKVDQIRDPDLKALINPGFTNVTSMDVIMEIAKKITTI